MCEPLTCPNPDCGEPWPLCIEKKGIRRRYKCLKCGFRFITVEQVEAAVEGQMFQAWLKGFLREEKR